MDRLYVLGYQFKTPILQTIKLEGGKKKNVNITQTIKNEINFSFLENWREIKKTSKNAR